ncbi:ATP-binding cassette domain-containing protein [Jannaschia sp. 2305UL9-9]|uniref:ATP-binding cassette domain-containing protein n=1 Tax=Jannaschia sp. 2305UL9-9 TaxID=3121638 RepID=UPI003529432B
MVRLEGASVRKRVGPLNLDIGAGTTVVLGPNGAGKTTLLRAIFGLDRLSTGRRHSADDRALGFVFQQPVLLRRSVRDNLAFPLGLRGADLTPVDAWLRRTGLTAQADLPANRLSGGERQLLALARALIAGPRLLLLDEPTAHLDGRATRLVEEVLMAAPCDKLLATHDLGQARRLADRVLFLHHGKLIEDAAGSAFFNRPTTSEARAFLAGDIVE